MTYGVNQLSNYKVTPMKTYLSRLQVVEHESLLAAHDDSAGDASEEQIVNADQRRGRPLDHLHPDVQPLQAELKSALTSFWNDLVNTCLDLSSTAKRSRAMNTAAMQQPRRTSWASEAVEELVLKVMSS